MQELEKILEEIDEIYVEDTDFGIECNLEGGNSLACDDCYNCIKEACKSIIRKHMTDEKSGECNCCKRYQKGYEDGKKNDGWIPVNSHGLPSSSEHDFRFWVTVQYKNGFRRTLKATWNYYNNHFVYQNGKIISEDVVAYRYYSAPKPYQAERSEG